MKKVIFLLLAFTAVFSTWSQSVAINHDGSQPNGRSILDVQSSSKGVMLPRMSSAQRNAIPVQASDAGLMVFDTDKQCLFIYNGTAWMAIPFGSEKNIHPVNYAPVDGQEDDDFGASVAILGNYAVVGAPYADIGSNYNQGSAYVYFHNGSTWEYLLKLTAADGVANDYFGTSVAITDGHIAVGATGVDAGGQNARGAVYVFQRQGNQWNQQVRLMMQDGMQEDHFGRAVAMQGNNLLIGAPEDDNGSYANQGSAYLYKFDGNAWTQFKKFTPGDLTTGDAFGYSLAIDGDYVVIGAPERRENNFSRAGAVYVFYGQNGANWNLQQKITVLQPAFEHWFGRSVAIHGRHLAVGVPGYTSGSSNYAGMISLHNRVNDTWVNTDYKFTTDPESEAYFGTSIAIKDSTAMSGAFLYNENNLSNSGAVWVYRKPAPNSSWVYDRKIADADPASVAFFGASMAIDRQTGRYIIGSPNAPGGGRVSFGTLN